MSLFIDVIERLQRGGELFLNGEIFHYALYGIVDFVIATFWGNN